ncbi:MAG: response regulator transcription factor, partial [Rubrobacteraceae bacterium]
MTIRIVLVDDQEMIRVGFRMILESRPEIEVVGEADDGDTALKLLETVQADVVLMDVRMPRMSGVEATRRIRAGDGPRVLILTTFDLDEYVYEALQAGASGFLLKDTPVNDLVSAITHVYLGDAVVAPSTTRRLLDHFASNLPAGREPRPVPDGHRLE